MTPNKANLKLLNLKRTKAAGEAVRRLFLSRSCVAIASPLVTATRFRLIARGCPPCGLPRVTCSASIDYP